MIKLIASDLDGTLLLPDRSLPQEIFPLIEKLYEKGILFCAASGRQYESLVRLFAPVKDKIVFLAENGAYVAYQGKTIFGEYLPSDMLPSIFKNVAAQPHAYPLLCTVNMAYGKDDYPPFWAECTKYYPHFTKVNDFSEVTDLAQVCKVAVFDDMGSAEYSGKNLPTLLPDLRVTVSGKVWCDVSMPQTNKGRAMGFIQQYFGFTPDECMAFGDYMNDYEMLLACRHGYVPLNGFPPLIEKIGKTIPSNGDLGVLQKIKEVLGEM